METHTIRRRKQPMKAAFDAYLEACQTEKALSRASLKSYRYYLNRFLRFVGQDAPLADFNLLSLQRFMTHLSAEGLLGSTRNCALTCLRVFGDWCADMGYLDTNPARDKRIKAPRKSPSTRVGVSDAICERLLDACARLYPARRAILARAVLSVLIYTGVRRGELLNLQTADANPYRQTLFIRHGKGDTTRTVNILESGADALAQWLKVRDLDDDCKRQKPCRHTCLWDFDRSRPMKDQGLRSLLRAVKVAAGFDADDPDILPHNLRHAYATRLLRQGAMLTTISKALGHAQTHTTFTYLHSSGQDVKEAAPLAALQPASAAVHPSSPKPAAWRNRLLRRT